MRWSIQVRIFLRLVLHLELREECLFKLRLLRGANRLPRYLLHVIELIEEMLIEVVPIVRPSAVPPEVHIVISTICTLMTQP